MLQFLNIEKFKLKTGKTVNVQLSYQLFGRELGTAPVILVNHALTGNSCVAGERGWWSSLIGKGKTIDLENFTVLSFNIPGNGYDGNLIENYKDYSIEDMAKIFLQGIEILNIRELHSIIGGSLGGAIAWQMAYLHPEITQNLIPIATDFVASDWLLAQCHVQENILLHSNQPLQDARVHAMLLYRTPESINQRFNREKCDEEKYQVQDWLDYHGCTLKKRFQKAAYALMNHLLTTICVAEKAEDLSKIQANIHSISIDSDLYFTHDRAQTTYKKLKKVKENIHFSILHSIHGHDAFLIEYEKLNQLLQAIFQQDLQVKKSA